MCENGIGRSDSAVTSQSEIKTASHAVSGNCRVHWRWKVFDRVHQRLTHSREFECNRSGQSHNLSQICTSREESFASRNYERLRFSRQVPEHLDQRQHACRRQAICTIAGFQTQYANTINLFEIEELSGRHLAFGTLDPRSK
jgi:hypothetical protein